MAELRPEEHGWQRLGALEPARLADARRQLHWAVQALAAVGYAWIERAPDDSQSNLGWVDGMQIFAGRLFGAEKPIFAALRPADLHVLLCDIGGGSLGELSLEGCTLDDAYGWIQETVIRHLGRLPGESLRFPPYELSAHPLGEEGCFEVQDGASLREVARWFHDANIVLRDLRARNLRSTMPRVWPHHFDLGMLISLESHGDPQRGRSIGLGLSPGYEEIPSPYWYVRPHPMPEGGTLPPLPAYASWHTQGWLGAVLDARTQIAAGEAEDQQKRAAAYVEAAVGACRALLAD